MNKHFFSSIKEWSAAGRITELYDEDDIVVSSSMDLTRVCNSCYSKLYVYPISNEKQKEYGKNLLSYVLSKFSLGAQKILEAPLIAVELAIMVQAFAKWKNLGPNGSTAEFFQAH